ncbi:MAG: type II secretion system major pseudopilin GspG [Candidatus Tectomicrobia bacterium]|uniref:Type II secretion system core protein G n=1 Tax=Tectimicrobiota bacterium TaxID=2528274 RepID=A0A932FVS4_UNCTE|nr:type II secretion system major pseudopilin GspG [Candidatus Tectomicrobia bacterium]
MGNLKFPIFNFQSSILAKRAGFTLIELLVVMVILGLLAALVAPRMFGKVEQSKESTAKAQIEMLGTALDSYRLDVGRYPDNLEELLSSNEKSWNGPYLKKKVPPDPWGEEYHYEMLESGREYHLSSNGGGNQEIKSWE